MRAGVEFEVRIGVDLQNADACLSPAKSLGTNFNQQSTGQVGDSTFKIKLLYFLIVSGP